MMKRRRLEREVLVLEGARARLKKTQLKELKEGEKFRIGEFNFLVLEQLEGRTKVISEGLLLRFIRFGDSEDYKKSYVRDALEENMLAKIEWEIGAANIIEHEVSLISVDNQRDLKSIVCKIRPLSLAEAKKYNKLLVDEKLEDCYWTLTPLGSTGRGWTGSIVAVAPSGDIRTFPYSMCNSVRPVLVLRANMYVSQETI